MKTIVLPLGFILLLGYAGCDRAQDLGNKEIPIQRQEDYDREDTLEHRRNLPVENDDELKLDNDYFTDDGVKIDD